MFSVNNPRTCITNTESVVKQFILLPLLLIPILLFAGNDDAEPIVIGERFTLDSKVMQEPRPIWVSQPLGYDQSSERYPLMILLDGDGHFHHTTGIIQFLTRGGMMPQMLVVGIPNTDRTRDLTPPALSDTTGRFSTAGGAKWFLQFITDELVPYVESHYRTQPYKIIVGHSFGGLFVVNALLHRPDVFDAYVAISPSLWWDNERLIRQTETFFQTHPELRKFLYVTLGNEGGNMRASFDKFVQILETAAPTGLEWSTELMENETHGSIPHRTTYNALEALYSDWRLPAEIVQNGNLKQYDKHFKKLSQKFGYEIRTPERDINILGYRLLGQDKFDEAIAVFKENVKRYPESANVYDSLGDGYDANGEFKLARESYEKAYKRGLEIDDLNVQVYKRNFERLQKKLAGGPR